MKRRLQNSIWGQICAFDVDSDFSQIAYDQQDMSICEKSNQPQKHQIWPPNGVLQLPLNLSCNSHV